MLEQPATRMESFLLMGFSVQSQHGSVTIRSFDRARRALAGLGRVAIPVAHFLLVPSFLIYGVIDGLKR